jgi:hypothetical protein
MTPMLLSIPNLMTNPLSRVRSNRAIYLLTTEIWNCYSEGDAEIIRLD